MNVKDLHLAVLLIVRISLVFAESKCYAPAVCHDGSMSQPNWMQIFPETTCGMTPSKDTAYLQENITKLWDEKNQLRETVITQREEISALQTQNDALLATINRNNATVQNLKTEMAEMRKQNGQRDAALERLNATAQDQKTENLAMKKQNDALREALDELNATTQDQNSGISAMKAEHAAALEELNTTAKSCKTEISEIKKQYGVQLEAVQSANTTVQDLKAEISAMKKQNDALHVKVQRTNATVQLLKGEAAKRTNQIDQLHAELEQLNTTAQGQKTDLRMVLRWTVGAAGWYVVEHNGRFYLYKLSDEKLNYADAQSNCSRLGSRLASAGMRIPEIRNDVISSLVQPRGESTWMGLDDLASQGNYTWSDGVASTTNNTQWGPGEPRQDDLRCVVLRSIYSYAADDRPCSMERYYLCETVHAF